MFGNVCNRCDGFVQPALVGPDVPLGDGRRDTGEMFTGLRFSGRDLL